MKGMSDEFIIGALEDKGFSNRQSKNMVKRVPAYVPTEAFKKAKEKGRMTIFFGLFLLAGGITVIVVSKQQVITYGLVIVGIMAIGKGVKEISDAGKEA